MRSVVQVGVSLVGGSSSLIDYRHSTVGIHPRQSCAELPSPSATLVTHGHDRRGSLGMPPLNSLSVVLYLLGTRLSAGRTVLSCGHLAPKVTWSTLEDEQFTLKEEHRRCHVLPERYGLARSRGSELA
jgi:hypothetical protein